MKIDLDEYTNWKVFAAHSAVVLAFLSAFCTIYPSFISNNGNSPDINNQLAGINSRLDLIDYKLEDLSKDQGNLATQFLVMQSYNTNYHSKAAGGDLNDTGLLATTVGNFTISIDPSLNNSISTERFRVFGNTNLDYKLIEDGIFRIYVILKLDDIYLVQTEGYPDDSQKWIGYRPCIIPGNFSNATIYAIITDEDLLVAGKNKEMPKYIAISNPMEINKV